MSRIVRSNTELARTGFQAGEVSLGRHKEKAAGRRPLSPTDHDQTDLMFGTNLRGLHSTLSFGFCFVRAVIDNGRRRGRWL